MPGFVTLDRVDLEPRAGAEVSHLVRDGADANRIDVHGTYVVPDSRFGLYGALPVTRLDGDQHLGVELDGFYSRRLGPNAEVVTRGGFAFNHPPSDQGDRPSTLAVPIRLVDASTMFTNGVTGRLGASYLRHDGAWFARADIGIDIGFEGVDGMASSSKGHIGGGVGVSLSVVAITAEIALSPAYGTSALGVRGTFGRVQPYAAVVLPLEDDAKAIGDVAITAGVEVLLACPE